MFLGPTKVTVTINSSNSVNISWNSYYMSSDETRTFYRYFLELYYKQSATDTYHSAYGLYTAGTSTTITASTVPYLKNTNTIFWVTIDAYDTDNKRASESEGSQVYFYLGKSPKLVIDSSGSAYNTSIIFYYNVFNCNSPVYYYYSTSSATPNTSSYTSSSTQKINTWCTTSDQDFDPSTFTNLHYQRIYYLPNDTSIKYYIWVAGTPASGITPTSGTRDKVTINGKTCYISNRMEGSIDEVGVHPSVSVGSPITAAQMRELEAWMAYAPNRVTQNSTILASDGSTYTNNTITPGTQLTASWYNGA